MIPVNEPRMAPNARQYVDECIDSGWISSAGSFVSTFEKNFADFLGVRHAVTTTSGTAALHLALASLKIGAGDEVILPTFTMMASAAAVLYTGATPVLVDSDPATWTLNTTEIEKKITSKTKAIMPVHIYGHPCDMDPIMALAKKYSLAVVEDAAEAHGAMYKGMKAGAIGDVGCFSFYANKIITTGEGGMVVTNDEYIAARARSLKDLAHSPAQRFVHDDLGFNYRMTNVQAAIGCAQLEDITHALETKEWMASLYHHLLSDIPGLILPREQSWARSVWWMYGLLVDDSFGMTRDALMKKLRTREIDTRTFFVPMHKQPILRRLGVVGDESFPVADDIATRGLYLPSGLAITEEHIRAVSDALHSLAREHGKS